ARIFAAEGNSGSVSPRGRPVAIFPVGPPPFHSPDMSGFPSDSRGVGPVGVAPRPRPPPPTAGAAALTGAPPRCCATDNIARDSMLSITIIFMSGLLILFRGFAAGRSRKHRFAAGQRDRSRIRHL